MAICARIRGSPAPRTSWRGVLLWGCARSMRKSATAPAMKTVASSTAPWQARTACIAFLIMIVFEINQSAAGEPWEVSTVKASARSPPPPPLLVEPGRPPWLGQTLLLGGDLVEAGGKPGDLEGPGAVGRQVEGRAEREDWAENGCQALGCPLRATRFPDAGFPQGADARTTTGTGPLDDRHAPWS